MTDRSTISHVVESLFEDWIDKNINVHPLAVKNMRMLEADTLELLKEQETVVHPEPSCEITYITDCCCDLCGVQLIREDIFCRCCGKRIVWESW